MKKFTDFPLLESKKKSYPLFYPYISKRSLKSINTVLKSRWIGQGPLVDILEEKFKKKICKNKLLSRSRLRYRCIASSIYII